MGVSTLLPRSRFRVQLTHASTEKQPHKDGKPFSEYLKEKCPRLADPEKAFYFPPWYMPNGDMQTIYLYTQHYKPAGCPIDYERQIFEFSDGGKAAADWALPRRSAAPDAPLIILVPGIAGTSYDYYARSFIHCVNQQSLGYQVVVLQSRGCNGVSLVTPKAFHGGMTSDLREFVEHIAETMPGIPLIGLGFSLGANILAKYIGEEGDGCRFIAAASVCNPYDIDMTVSSMCMPSLKNRYLYAAALTRSLVSLFTNNQKIIMAGGVELDASRITASRNINEFNEEYTIKVFGVSSVKELNRSGSCTLFLKHIQIPMLFINALDDPMCYRETIPYGEFESNPNLIHASTRYGGHLAFFEGTYLSPWLPNQLAQFIQAMVEWNQATGHVGSAASAHLKESPQSQIQATLTSSIVA
ncbi:hypothetical protein GGI25_002625 [Coemansia spiralis]|uniref:AB hydrolase-1 domain-containing protein n=2 Tax=Coemansia TaxID=4863 RepID=A0A9W8G7K6_9FUNG|nr:Alpha/Beta hydrolase protein [Coemansia spiralis]KAJ1989811.1 hypothetical protein EDC05_004431 [Coemansia umbellata]KAJ2620602.1 hypothetical protein GGI26_004834 [Coemansia sp. RSA 1358]KAJ2678121.1 hypothetical protein GGI25_002625 [Coemansia spiralis]